MMLMGATAAIATSLMPPLPFLLAGCLPLWVGALLAGISGLPMRWGALVLATLAVAALILAAFAARDMFSPEAGRCPAWRLQRTGKPATPAYGALGAALTLGLVLQFGWGTGDYTLPLVGLGVLGGYFSFAPPLAWHRRAGGEAVGGFCFGLLPVATGLYLQCGHLLTDVLLYGLPLTFAGFNLFLVYGWPEPGTAPQGRSLAARVRPVTAALIYTLVNILVIIGLLFIWVFPAGVLPWRWGLAPLAVLAVVNQELVKRKAYRQSAGLQLLGRLTLALHLGMGLIFVVMLGGRL